MFIVAATIPYGFCTLLPIIGLDLYWCRSYLLSSISYWRSIWRCNSLWRNIWVQDQAEDRKINLSLIINVIDQQKNQHYVHHLILDNLLEKNDNHPLCSME